MIMYLHALHSYTVIVGLPKVLELGRLDQQENALDIDYVMTILTK